MKGLSKTFLFFIFAASFIVRALFFVFFINHGTNYFRGSNDAREYNDIALQISKGNGISFSLWAPGFYYMFQKSERPKIVPDFYRLPGYPIFLAIFYKLFGAVPQIPIWVQIFLSSLIPILVFFLSLAIFPENIFLAKIASIISAFYFGFVLYSCVMFSESLFLLLFLLFLIYFFRCFSLFFCVKKRPFSPMLIVLAGIFLGMASLFRAVGPYVLFLSVILFMFSNFTISEKIKGTFILVMSWTMIVFWWLLRNWILTGYIFFHSLPGIHFFSYPGVRMGMKAYNCDYQSSRAIMMDGLKQRVNEFERQRGAPPSEIEICIITEKFAQEFFVAMPFKFLKLSTYHMLKTMFGAHPTEYDEVTLCSSSHATGSLAWNIFLSIWIYLEYIIILGFLLFLIMSFFKLQWTCTVLKTAPFILLVVFLALAEGLARLRLPAMPLIIILGTYAIFYIFDADKAST